MDSNIKILGYLFFFSNGNMFRLFNKEIGIEDNNI